MTAPDQQQDVDGSDEADHDAQEVAIGAALAVLLIAWLLPGPSSFFGGGTAWNAQIDGVVGPTIAGFIQRSAFDLAQASGIPNASVAAAQASSEVYPKVMSEIERWTHQTLTNLSDRHIEETELSAVAKTAAENVGRSVAAYAKSEARSTTAGKLGAVWSIWRTRHDSRVRDTHRDLDEAKVPFGGRFVTDGGHAYLRFPGDPEAPLSETMGCRCHLVFRFRPKETSYGEV